MTSRLSNATVGDLPADIERPGYDRSAVKTGVVHLGIGAFHRAHQAVVFDDALRSGDLRWGVLGVSLRSASVADQLNPQDGLYTLLVRDGDRETSRVVGAIKGVLVAPQDPAAVVAALADPDVHLVTLTVTEKGYHLDPAGGALRLDDAEIAVDIADITRPRTATGFLVAGLAERRSRGLAPFTVISCDNLPSNGERLRAAVLTLARAVDGELADWIEATTAFPSSMVDRIVPATTDADRDALTTHTGLRDDGLVKTEPFSQWVLEDRFAGTRPDFAALGVQLTGEVEPWEKAKLRLLNGAHSALAYLGGLADHAFVHEAVAAPAFAAYLDWLWNEAETTLNPPAALDLVAYRQALMTRFQNPALQHRTDQIATDGSQKLPQRLLGPISDRLDAGQAIDALALAVAGWIRWQGGHTEAGRAFVVHDPLAVEIGVRLGGSVSGAEMAETLMGFTSVFPQSLANDLRFRRAIVSATIALTEVGAVKAIEALTKQGSAYVARGPLRRTLSLIS